MSAKNMKIFLDFKKNNGKILEVIVVSHENVIGWT
jgi:hypothetical protein